MESISDKVIEKIKKEKIKPTPKWHFLLKNYILWSGFVVSVAIGSLSFSIAFHQTNENDWDIYGYLGKGYTQFIMETIPYLWLGIILVFLAVAYYNYRHTSGGYRFRAYYILLSSLFLSFIFGYGCYALGIGKMIDEELDQKANCGCGINTKQRMTWSQPEKGLLAGKVVEIRLSDEFDLEDFDGNIWQIRKDDGEEIIYRNIVIRPDEQVKVIGQRGGELIFFAKEVRPWMKGEKNHREIESDREDD
jgi:hypothetical protein